MRAEQRRAKGIDVVMFSCSQNCGASRLEVEVVQIRRQELLPPPSVMESCQMTVTGTPILHRCYFYQGPRALLHTKHKMDSIDDCGHNIASNQHDIINDTTLAEKDNTPESAACRVFAIYELREAILVQYALQNQILLPPLTPEQDGDAWLDTDLCKEIPGPALGLYALQRVNRAFAITISQSPLLRELMCRQPRPENISASRWFLQILGMEMVFLGGELDDLDDHQIPAVVAERRWWEGREMEIRYRETYFLKTHFSASILKEGGMLPAKWTFDERDETSENCHDEEQDETLRYDFNNTWRSIKVFNTTEPMMRRADANGNLFHQLSKVTMICEHEDIPTNVLDSIFLDLRSDHTLYDFYIMLDTIREDCRKRVQDDEEDIQRQEPEIERIRQEKGLSADDVTDAMVPRWIDPDVESLSIAGRS